MAFCRRERKSCGLMAILDRQTCTMFIAVSSRQRFCIDRRINGVGHAKGGIPGICEI